MLWKAIWEKIKTEIDMKRLFVIPTFIIILALSALAMSACGCSHENVEYRIVAKPTYSESGYIGEFCADCDKLIGRAVGLPRLSEENLYDEVTVVTAPTCTEGGRKKYVYVYDSISFEFEEDVPKTEHTPVTYTAKDASLHTSTCACGHTEDATHAFVSTVTKEPTCNQYGEALLTCSFCGYQKTDSVIPISHTPVPVDALVPTCTEDGYMAGERCSVCGGVVSGLTVIPKNGHNYVSGVCSVCGDKERVTVTYVIDGVTDVREFFFGDKFYTNEQASTDERVFRGWYTEGGVKYTAGTVLTSNVTVYAKFDVSIPVGTKEAFLAIFASPDKAYHLTADINLGGEVVDPITLFSGVLDGKGHTVKNFSVSSNECKAEEGLIGINEGIIKNLVIRDYIFNINVTATPHNAAVGALVGHNKGVISDLKLDAMVNTSVAHNFGDNGYHLNIGGLVGVNDGVLKKLTLNYAYNAYTNTYNPISGVAYPDRWGSYNIGRVVGANNGEMSEIFDTGDMTLDVEMGLYWMSAKIYVSTNVGTLAAYNAGKITRSYHIGALHYEPDSAYGSHENESLNIGGFVGLNDGEISESFTESSITGGVGGSLNLGGFVGLNDNKAKISSSYADSIINSHVQGSSSVGGFAGRNDALVQNCYSAGEIHSSVGATLGGFVGMNDTGGTVARSYTKMAVNAGSYRSGPFAGDNHSIISMCYILDTNHYNPGSSVTGNLSITTEIDEVTLTELVSLQVMRDRLYWNEEGWVVNGTDEPTLAWRNPA